MHLLVSSNVASWQIPMKKGGKPCLMTPEGIPLFALLEVHPSLENGSGPWGTL